MPTHHITCRESLHIELRKKLEVRIVFSCCKGNLQKQNKRL